MATTFQAVAWEARDGEEQYNVHIFGRTEDGKSVCLTTPFDPYFFVKLDDISQKGRIKEEHGGLATKIQLMKKKDLWGFQNNKEFYFLKFNFNTLKDMKNCSYALKRANLKIYEANIEPFLRLMHRTNIKSTGWMKAVGNPNNVSRCDIDIAVDDWKTIVPVDRDDIAPLKIMSFDIECTSSTGKFPDPNIAKDEMFQVACTTRCHGSDEIISKKCFCYKQTEGGDDIISFDTEREMLEAFAEHVREVDPDALTGYNIFGFDLKYIYTRAAHPDVRCSYKFYQLGRLRTENCSLMEKRLSSGALGDNTLTLLPMNGRYIFDLFHEIKREKKLDSYSLNNVSKTFLGDQKIDMPAKEMFARFARGDPKELGEVAEYCLKDTLLPHRLIDKLCIFTNLLEMAKATWVPLSYLSERGQQIKVYSQIMRKARDLGFLVPTIQKKIDYALMNRLAKEHPEKSKDEIRMMADPDEKYEGATVLEAHIGAYYEPITALDFASLYPSIMVAHNMCYSSLVMEPRYNNIPGVTYEDFTIKNQDGKETVHRFAQDVPSLLPVILQELKEFRKKAKKLMAEHRGTHMEEVYNGQQLAYKISMNSIYGFTGARKGILPCVPIAASTTCQGRNMISMTKECVEDNFPGAVVRYGDTDSVMIQFDCKGMTTDEAIEHSWQIGEKAAELCNGLFKKPNDLELEKVYCPYILYSKKRYAAKMWTRNRQGAMEMEKIDVKGLQLVRRDNTPYTREVCKEVLDLILESNDPKPAIIRAKDRAQQLVDGEVPMEKLIMSKSLADRYKVRLSQNTFVPPNATPKTMMDMRPPQEIKDKIPVGPINDWEYSKMVNGEKQYIPAQPHIRVLEKINERSPGSHPHPGDRVPFVLVKTDNPQAKMFDKAEDPEYVKVTPSVELDFQYYFTNQLKKPIEDLLDPLVKGADIFTCMMPPKKPKKKDIAKDCRKISDIFAKLRT